MVYSNKIIKIILLFNLQFVMCSGGFDHGTAVGKGRLQLDFTINPFDMIEYGQTYVVISYGIAQDLDLHGYFSHVPTNVNQFYQGLMYQFFEKEKIDLSTALGFRYGMGRIDVFFPQLLYTMKLNRFNIGGSLVSVKDLTNDEFLGITFDIAIFILMKKMSDSISFIEKMELGVGFFKNIGDTFYPTYSIDMKLKKF